MITNNIFNLHRTTREHLIAYLDKLSPEQLAFVPNGFHNNIFWNIAHCVVAQQVLCYKFSGLALLISDEMVQKYMKGTSPTGKVPTLEEIQEVRNLLIFTHQQLQNDYTQGKFTQYTSYLTSYNFKLACIEDAIIFNNTHEAMHLGTIKTLYYFK